MKWIHPSSLVTWFCYGLGINTALASNSGALLPHGSSALTMAAAMIAFFIIVIAVQRYMGFSVFSWSFGAPNRLITSGPFAWTRNPIYVAFLIPLLALAAVSIWVAVGTIAIYIVAMNTFVIKHEERALLEAYGDDYRVYSAKTPRWILA